MATPTTTVAPADFRSALRDLSAVRVRPEIEISELPAPAKLAPWSHALELTLQGDYRSESASGRLVLLYDPNGAANWEGTFRIVAFLTTEIEGDMAIDPLLAEVAWSWLVESLDRTAAGYVALGGTVTATTSTRFGDIAGPSRVDDLELRASWTVDDGRVGRHLLAFADLLIAAAGLPPEGVAAIGQAASPNARSS